MKTINELHLMTVLRVMREEIEALRGVIEEMRVELKTVHTTQIAIALVASQSADQVESDDDSSVQSAPASFSQV